MVKKDAPPARISEQKTSEIVERWNDFVKQLVDDPEFKQTIEGKQISLSLLQASVDDQSSSGTQAIEGKVEIVAKSSSRTEQIERKDEEIVRRSDDFFDLLCPRPSKKVKSSSTGESSYTQVPEPAKDQGEKIVEPDPCFKDINYNEDDQVFLESIVEEAKKSCMESGDEWLGVVDEVPLEEFGVSDSMGWPLPCPRPRVANIPRPRVANIQGFGGSGSISNVNILNRGDYYAKICAFSIKKYNKKNGTNYKCVRILGGTYRSVGGIEYLLTFLAIDDPNNNLKEELQQRPPSTFEARVWFASFCRGGSINFMSCRRHVELHFPSSRTREWGTPLSMFGLVSGAVPHSQH